MVSDDCAAGENCVEGSCVKENVDACESAVDCNADQRCANNVCNDLQFCDDLTFRDIDRTRCEFTWKRCDDSKDYDFICTDEDGDGSANCECKINGVVVATPTVEFNSMVCGEYRVVNDACNWFLETNTP